MNAAKTEIESLKGQIDHLAEKNIGKNKVTEENDTSDEIVDFVNHVIENVKNCSYYTGFPSVQLLQFNQLHDCYQYLDQTGEIVILYKFSIVKSTTFSLFKYSFIY